METYRKTFTIEVPEATGWKQKVHEYLTAYNFEPTGDQRDSLTFIKPWSILEGWKFNPLHWESDLRIKMTGNQTLTVDYQVFSNSMISAVVFSTLYHSFIKNLKVFLLENKDVISSNHVHLQHARKTCVKMVIFQILGIGLGLLIGIVFSQLTGIKYIPFLGILAAAFLSPRVINTYLIKNQDLASDNL